MMDISSVSIPAVPESQVQPPQNAEVQNAVRESAESGSAKNSNADSGEKQGKSENLSTLGRHVDERV
jgi:hypothetical protein